MLTKRLKELELAGMIKRDITAVDGSDGKPIYTPTPAGQALLPVVVTIGDWGMQHARGDMSDEEMDVDLLMWDIRRRIISEAIPNGKACIRFHYPEQQRRYANWWITIEGDERELCVDQPEQTTDLTFCCAASTMIHIWMGDCKLEQALKNGDLEIQGEGTLRQQMNNWLGHSIFIPERMTERSHNL